MWHEQRTGVTCETRVPGVFRSFCAQKEHKERLQNKYTTKAVRLRTALEYKSELSRKQTTHNTHQPFCLPICYKTKKMEQSTLYTICGYVASTGLILGYLPQAIETIRTRNTDGIALPTFLMMAVGAFAFMLQGLLHKPNIIWSMFITNAVTCLCSCIVFAIKIDNDYFKKKK